MRALSLCALLLGAAHAEIRQLPVRTDWVGNTLLRGEPWKDPAQTYLQLYTSDLAVSSDGFVYLTTTWEEGSRAAGIYRNGDALPEVAPLGLNSGEAVAVTDSNVVYGRKGELLVFTRAPGRGIDPHSKVVHAVTTTNITGVAMRGEQIFYSAGNLVCSLDGQFEKFVERAGKLRIETNGNLWVWQKLQPAALLKRTDESQPVAAIRFVGGDKFAKFAEARLESDEGTLATFGDRPAGWPEEWLKIDPPRPLHHIRVTGPDAALKELDTFTATPELPGRWYCFAPDGRELPAEPVTIPHVVEDEVHVAGKSFRPGPWKNIRGLDVDAAGNVYVCTVGEQGIDQTRLACYAPTGELRWQMEGLAFLNTVDLDPADPTVAYSGNGRYRNWQAEASTVDRRRYPDDPRFNGCVTLYGVRRINGQPYLIISTQSGRPLCVYRFDGDTAVPYALISDRNTGKRWPPNQPLGFGPFIWRDRNGDGQFQRDEYEKIPRDVSMWSLMNIDEHGDLWVCERQRLRRMAGPDWSFQTNVAFTLPAMFTRIGGFEVTDAVYLFGFTKELPHLKEVGQNHPLGRWLARCEIKDGQLVVTHTRELPYNVNLAGVERDQPYCSAVAGDYVFVGMERRMTILVYRAADLELVGRLDPGPQTTRPIFDGPVELIARKVGAEYLLFMPQYLGNATTILRWTGQTDGWKPPLDPSWNDGVLSWTPETNVQIERRQLLPAGWSPWQPATNLTARQWRDDVTGTRAYRLREPGSDWSRTLYIRP